MTVGSSKNYFLLVGGGTTKRFCLAALNALMLLFAMSLFSGAVEFGFAQDIFGRIVGTITDSSGAVVPDVKVRIVNEATLVPRVVTADKDGYFVANELQAGTYSVTAERDGFKTLKKEGNALTAGGRLTVDLTLQVGTVSETVRITAMGDTVNTTSGEISATITQQEVQNLALNQRHYESLVGLVPGAALQGSGTNPAALTSNYNNSVADINGQRLDGQNWSVDGGFNLDSGSNNSVFNQVGIDFIQEVDVQTSNYDAEFGRSASSTINVVTRSGGDQYHGGAFEFVQNNIFNAENAGTKLTNPTAKGYAGRAHGRYRADAAGTRRVVSPCKRTGRIAGALDARRGDVHRAARVQRDRRMAHRPARHAGEPPALPALARVAGGSGQAHRHDLSQAQVRRHHHCRQGSHGAGR